MFVNDLGKNMHTQRCTLLEDTISKGEPFCKITPGIKKAIEDEIDKRHADLLANIQGVFDIVIDDFDSLFVVDEEPNLQRDQFRQKVQQFVELAHAKMNGPVETELATAMKGSE